MPRDILRFYTHQGHNLTMLTQAYTSHLSIYDNYKYFKINSQDCVNAWHQQDRKISPLKASIVLKNTLIQMIKLIEIWYYDHILHLHVNHRNIVYHKILKMIKKDRQKYHQRIKHISEGFASRYFDILNTLGKKITLGLTHVDSGYLKSKFLKDVALLGYLLVVLDWHYKRPEHYNQQKNLKYNIKIIKYGHRVIKQFKFVFKNHLMLPSIQNQLEYWYGDRSITNLPALDYPHYLVFFSHLSCRFSNDLFVDSFIDYRDLHHQTRSKSLDDWRSNRALTSQVVKKSKRHPSCTIIATTKSNKTSAYDIAKSSNGHMAFSKKCSETDNDEDECVLSTLQSSNQPNGTDQHTHHPNNQFFSESNHNTTNCDEHQHDHQKTNIMSQKPHISIDLSNVSSNVHIQNNCVTDNQMVHMLHGSLPSNSSPVASSSSSSPLSSPNNDTTSRSLSSYTHQIDCIEQNTCHDITLDNFPFFKSSGTCAQSLPSINPLNKSSDQSSKTRPYSTIFDRGEHDMQQPAPEYDCEQKIISHTQVNQPVRLSEINKRKNNGSGVVIFNSDSNMPSQNKSHRQLDMYQFMLQDIQQKYKTMIKIHSKDPFDRQHVLIKKHQPTIQPSTHNVSLYMSSSRDVRVKTIKRAHSKADVALIQLTDTSHSWTPFIQRHRIWIDFCQQFIDDYEAFCADFKPFIFEINMLL